MAASKSEEKAVPVGKPRGRPIQKGQVLNPTGRPKKTAQELDLIAACKSKTLDALAVIEGIMSNGETEKNKLSAALAIIERAYGKPVQPTDAKIDATVTIEAKRPKLTREEWLAYLVA